MSKKEGGCVIVSHPRVILMNSAPRSEDASNNGQTQIYTPIRMFIDLSHLFEVIWKGFKI